jgi:methionyl-tRNA synthetase
MPRFYISTPIYYVNDVPHLGHAYTTIAADALARFHRSIGDDTRFLTGTDEHGLKVEQAASERGLQPLQLADQVVERFRSTWKHLDIGNDDFIRTTEARHKEVVSELWRRMAARGDIYKGSYEGWYCVKCEAYYPEAELADGRLCPTHKSPATWLSEPTYFFRLSNYQQPLLEHFEKNPTFVQPEGYRNEVIAFLKSGLRDLSVSRTTFRWGIPVPGDEEHVIYVWIDALTNYMAALGPIDGELYKRYWPATCHLIGKDILKFHAVYWPCMLLSAGLPLPETIFSHGWWTVRGEKISKSMPATRVDPNQLADDIGVDAVRYYLLREVPLGLDGDFAYEKLIGRYNAELAHDLGNLVSRALTVAGKFTGGAVPPANPELTDTGRHGELAREARAVIVEAADQLRSFAPSRALETIWRLIRETNRYVNDTQPWSLARDPARRPELDHAVRTALEAIACAARMVAPIMPHTGREICRLVGGTDELSGTWPAPDRFGQELTAGSPVGESQILFPRIDEDRQAALLDRWIPQDARSATDGADGQAAAKSGAAKGAATKTKSPTGKGEPAKGTSDAGATKTEPAAPTAKDKAAPATDGPITVDDFGRLDLRVAQVLEAAAIPGAKKLLRLVLDAGEPEPRQVVAGIAEAYQPDQLIGRKVILLANLKPATIRGVTSQGMILAAGAERVLGLSAVDGDVPVGTKVR